MERELRVGGTDRRSEIEQAGNVREMGGNRNQELNLTRKWQVLICRTNSCYVVYFVITEEELRVGQN